MLKSLGRRAHLWIGDGDSLEGSLAQWAPWYDEARQLESAKDDSDTEAAVAEAVRAGAQEVWLIGGGGGRMDHWWANVRMTAAQPAVTRWLTGHEEVCSLGPGAVRSLREGTVSVFPIGVGPWAITSTGLRWPLEAVDFRYWHSLSNEATPGASLTVESGQFLVLLPWEALRG